VDRPLLNANQQRRVATHLRLLREDLEDVASWPELARPGEPYASLRGSITRLLDVVADLARRLGLPAHQPPPLRRRVQAVGEVWASSLEDIKARHLRGYGEVHPGLAEVLDPRADELVRRLQELAALAARLPER